MQHQTAPIGVFDSGVGGLSVLRALRSELPQERFVYVSDSAHMPYGERSESFVKVRTHTLVQYLLEQHHAKAVVIACNTATAAAIADLRQHHPQLPLVGIEPAIKPASLTSATGRVGVLATRGTLQSQKFQTLMQRLATQTHFVCQPCDGLAEAIERHDQTRTQTLCQQYLNALGPLGQGVGQIDTVVLGCTHYPFASETLQQLAGPQVNFIESGVPVARHTQRLLQSHGIDHKASSNHTQSPTTTFETTGAPLALEEAAKCWLDWKVLARHIDR